MSLNKTVNKKSDVYLLNHILLCHKIVTMVNGNHQLVEGWIQNHTENRSKNK